MEYDLQLVECPRDAMQGWKRMIPTDQKVEYINSLLEVGFHTIDFGSYVSPRHIPQMADTAEVLAQLNPSTTKLLAIIANRRGAEEACKSTRIYYLGFPFSVSETFQQRNTNSSREESLVRVREIQELCTASEKELVVYMSMGFGNPYGDPYGTTILIEWMKKIHDLGVKIISLADTVGMATAHMVRETVEAVIPAFPGAAIGVHLHSTPYALKEKFFAAWDAGCRRIDGAIGGIGGCPMADDELVGNMDTASILQCLEERKVVTGINKEAFNRSAGLAKKIFY